MAAPAEGSARRPPVGRALSESFAVIANRKHTLAVRNCVKFRGVFFDFRPPNALLAANLCDNPANLCDNRAFLEDDRPHDDIGIV
jgi:hypothetical protein